MAQEAAYKTVDEMTFREASTELEQIVRALEQGDLELEDALERYGRGVELLASLRERLLGAEQKVRDLLEASTEMPVIETAPTPTDAFLNN
jgi:exodeoxyribonuclease VII small subunit